MHDVTISCGSSGKSKGKGRQKASLWWTGARRCSRWWVYTLPRPPGMVYVPQVPSIWVLVMRIRICSFSARNRSVSISGFWMDATEITNNETSSVCTMGSWLRYRPEDGIRKKPVQMVTSTLTGRSPDHENGAIQKSTGTTGWYRYHPSPDERIFGKKKLILPRSYTTLKCLTSKRQLKRECW